MINAHKQKAFTFPWWQALVTIHRFYDVLIFLLFCLCIVPLSIDRIDASSIGLLVYVFVLIILHMIARVPLNNYADRHLDARDPAKRHYAQACETLGARVVLAIAICELGGTTALAFLLSLALHREVFFIIFLLITVGEVVYNFEPVYTKGRGLWNPAYIALSYGFASGLLVYLSLHTTLSLPMGLLLVGMTFFAFSLALWHCTPDIEMDAAMGIRTPAVRSGVRISMKGAIGAHICALLLLFVGFNAIVGPFWSMVSLFGCAGLLITRLKLTLQATSDRTALDRIRDPYVILSHKRWIALAFLLFLIPGVIHLVGLSVLYF
jgi:4-hydroxybenzoate polyprenyltransferase